MAGRSSREALKIVFLCVLWYGSSTGSNIISKQILSELPYPLTVAVVHMLTLTCLLGPATIYFKIPPTPDVTKKFYLKRLVPLALGKLLGAISTHFSIWKVPVSYAHTVKALMPLFTVLLSIVILRESFHWKVYAALLPIVGGVLIATVTEIRFDLSGMLAALFSTLCFALQNIYSKKSIREVRIHHLRLLLVLTQISVLLLFPIWMYTDVWNIIINIHKVQHISWILIMLPISGLLSFAQNIAAFSMISAVSPVSYSVANSTKRIVIIVISLIMLRNPVSMFNICGMGLAVCGVILYNKVKYDSNKAEAKQQLLPQYHDTSRNGIIARNNSFIQTPLKII